jgi:hypothetical protein
MVWSASVINFLMSNCVHFGTYMPDISRDIKLSSEQDNVSGVDLCGNHLPID